MTFGTSLSTRPRRSRRPVSDQDLFMYELIVGKAAEIAPQPVAEAVVPTGMTPIHTVAKRFKPAMADLTVRLCNLYEQHINQGVRPQVAVWFRQVSNEASRRLDEAHARLNSRTSANRRQVEAREVILPIRPAETAAPLRKAA